MTQLSAIGRISCAAFLLLAAAASLRAGQSIEYGAQNIYNETIPTVATNRVEIWVCWTTASTYTHILSGPGGAFGNGAFGWSAYFVVGPPLSIAMRNAWDDGPGTHVDLSGSTGCVSLRLQHDKPNVLDDYEVWNIVTGERLLAVSLPYTTETDSGIGIDLGNGGEPTVTVAFLRALTSIVPLNSTPPVTFNPDASRIFEWKFEGNLLDSTSNGYNATYGSGSPTYIPTDFQSPPLSVIAANPLTWANVTSVRAGTPVPLDGTRSYSQADTSASVTCLWQELSGPSQLVWLNGNSSCTPNPIGAVWGDYVIQLTVKDVNGVTASTQTDVGSAAQDSKCVVVNADPNADIVFGYLIAYGCNPWGFSDQWENGSLYLKCVGNYGMSAGCNSPATTILSFAGLQWNQTGTGTVSYVWGGVGPTYPGGLACANSLTGSITATALTIPISNASCLDLTSYPTHIVIGTNSGAEDVRIIASSATSGAANLTVAYDGRGYLSPATAWASTTGVQQFKVTGSGTNFAADPTAPVCPLGYPSPTGPSYYSSGTITLTAGSAAVTGSGTTFTSAMVGSYLVATATHSATPYVLIRQISGYTSATSITLASVFPSDSDTGSYSYNITLGQRTLDLRANHHVDTSSIGQWLWNASECESATMLYLNVWVTGNEFASGHAPGFNVGTTFSALPYSVTDTCCYTNNSALGGINFYGESGAWRKLGLRSGYTSAMNAANLIDDYLTNSPWGQALTEGNGVFELESGGPTIMAFASAVLGAGSGPGAGLGASWGDLRSYAEAGYENVTGIYNGGSIQCWNQDTRSNSYAEAGLVLAALYDPDPTWKAQWVSDLTLMQTVDTACHQSDYSWSQSALFGGGSQAFGPVTLTHGLTAMTGTLTLNGGGSACTGTGYGTGSVVNGSGVLTISTTTAGSVSGSDAFTVTGTMSGQPYTIQVMYSAAGGPIQLAGLWPGDTGAVTWMAVNTSGTLNNLTAYGTDNADTNNLIQNYDCFVTGSGTAVIDRAWAGTTGSAYSGLLYVLAGYGQQPFYNGINAYRLRLMANSSLPSASVYQGFLNNTVNWIKTVGFNSTGLYTNYGSVFSFCVAGDLLVTNTTASNTLPQLSPGCNYPIQPTQPTYLANDREQNSELGIACSAYYALNPTSGNKTFCDQLYGAVWGNQSYNTGGVYFDQYSTGLTSNYPTTNLSVTGQGSSKWPGFFCGMGDCDGWPAFRLGGVDPTVTSDIYEPFTLSGISGAAKVSITFTAATGVPASTVCTSSPCHLTNIRQHIGWGLMRMDYENSGGAVIAPGINLPLFVP